jgi:hypothetical protein
MGFEPMFAIFLGSQPVVNRAEIGLNCDTAYEMHETRWLGAAVITYSKML